MIAKQRHCLHFVRIAVEQTAQSSHAINAKIELHAAFRAACQSGPLTASTAASHAASLDDSFATSNAAFRADPFATSHTPLLAAFRAACHALGFFVRSEIILSICAAFGRCDHSDMFVPNVIYVFAFTAKLEPSASTN